METPEAYIESFPQPVLTKIDGKPSYDTLNIVNDELSANAASVHTELGGGSHGYLAITVSPTVYATLSATAFVPPTLPEPVVTTGLTGPQISAANRTYDAAKKKFKEYNALQNALKKQLIAAVDNIYLEAIAEPYIKFGNRTIFDMLTHLFDTYAEITPSEMMENQTMMNKAWDPSLPIEVLFKQIQDASAFADRGGAAFSTAQIVNTAYTLVFNTGLFYDECKEWRKRTLPLRKDWPSFKQHFTEAYNDWKTTQRNTARTRSHTANAAVINQAFEEETIQAIANLATATAADRATTARLTATNSNLTAELKATQEKLVAALEKIAILSSTSNQAYRSPLAQIQPNANVDKRPLDRHYCWTHGYLCEHTSGRCPAPAEGHVKFATARKPNGGSTAKKDEWIKRVTKVE